MTATEVAQLLGRSRRWLFAHRARLEAEGFPRRDPALKAYLREAVECWIAMRALPQKQKKPRRPKATGKPGKR